MIYTVTVNPALDYVLQLEKSTAGKLTELTMIHFSRG